MICVKVIQVNDTNRIGFLISMIVNIVIFCAIGVAVIYWANNDSSSHNFYAANWIVFIITAPVTGITALALLIAVLILLFYLEAEKD